MKKPQNKNIKKSNRDHEKARNIQQVWGYIHIHVYYIFNNEIDNIPPNNIMLKEICEKRYKIAKEKNIKNQKLTLLLLIHIAYLRRYISISKSDMCNCIEDTTNSLFGIRKFVVNDYQFFDMIKDMIPTSINQMSINNLFRRTGFRPLKGDWVSFWNTDDRFLITASSKTMEYYGFRN